MHARTVVPLLAVALLIAAAPAADQAGSSEAQTVDRSCGAPHDDRYDPPSGDGLAECQDAEGNHDPERTYSATHWTNDVSCGDDHQLVPGTETAGVRVSGDGSADGDGFLQACSDGDLPINGRATVDSGGTVSIDGDRDNEVEQLQGWARVDVADGTVRCGKSYADGGRGDASHPTDEDTQDECG